MNNRQLLFMLNGLKLIPEKLLEYNILFFLLEGKAQETLPSLIKSVDAGLLVTDFDPLRLARKQRNSVY